MVRRWNVGVKLGWRLASGFFDRVAQRKDAPVVSVEVAANALLVRYNAASMRSLIGLHANYVYFFRYFQHRQIRPQAPTAT